MAVLAAAAAPATMEGAPGYVLSIDCWIILDRIATRRRSPLLGMDPRFLPHRLVVRVVQVTVIQGSEVGAAAVPVIVQHRVIKVVL